MLQRMCRIRDADPYRFCLDPDPFQSLPWNRIRNEFFHILDPDPCQNDTDPPAGYPAVRYHAL